jgi:hypothetical protein
MWTYFSLSPLSFSWQHHSTITHIHSYTIWRMDKGPVTCPVPYKRNLTHHNNKKSKIHHLRQVKDTETLYTHVWLYLKSRHMCVSKCSRITCSCDIIDGINNMKQFLWRWVTDFDNKTSFSSRQFEYRVVSVFHGSSRTYIYNITAPDGTMECAVLPCIWFYYHFPAFTVWYACQPDAHVN